MKRVVGLLLAGSCASACWAADKPVFAPPEAWVSPLPPPPDDGKADGAAMRLLLQDQQFDLQPGRISTYSETVMKIQTPAGLNGGSVAIPWNPDLDTLTVHKLLIRRGTQVIDVLASGQTFTVLRRETNLENAVLDGVLTASLQPEGLQVGDVIDFAVTMTHRDPALGHHVEAVAGGFWNAIPIGRAHLSVRWPTSVPLRIQSDEGMPAITPVRSGDEMTASVDLKDLEPLHPPSGAPTRFAVLRLAEMSDAKSWADMAALMRPLYDKASVIPAGSPLAVELDKIKAAGTDPKARAEAALALVQSRVRYVFLGMNDGGLVPADAATTWSRRFGDCKGKTALLLGLLRGLGVEAEPVLASTVGGDGLDEREPMLSLFNHVLVRARIGGRDYWLDGTRLGDTRLDQIETPNFGWGLPLGGDSTKLVRILPPPRTAPILVTSVRIDATGGIYAPVPFHVETVMGGDDGYGVSLRLADLSDSARDQALREYWRQHYDSVEIKQTGARYDPANRTEHLTMDGLKTMDWAHDRYDADDMGVGYSANFQRDPGPHADAPFAVAYPTYARYEETILLPNGGAGLDVTTGANVDQTVAGMTYHREAKIEKGRFEAVETERSIAPEFPASEAKAAQATLRTLVDQSLQLAQLPAYHLTQADMAVVAQGPASSPEEHYRRSIALLATAKFDEAAAEFAAVLSTMPKNVGALWARGQAKLLAGKTADARPDFDAALAIDPKFAPALGGRGQVEMADGQLSKALDDLTAGLAVNSGDPSLRLTRAKVYLSMGDKEHALADLSEMMTLHPDEAPPYLLHAATLVSMNKPDLAAADAAALSRNAGNDPVYTHVAAAKIYAAVRRRSDAMAEFDRALAIKPLAYVYVNRSEIRPREDHAGKLADLDAALKLEPTMIEALEEKATLLVRYGNARDAVALLDKALVDQPDNIGLHVRRAIAHAQLGEAALAAADLAAAHKPALQAYQLNDICWTEATAGVLLDAALADCNAALAKTPRDAAALDSRALVLMRLGRDHDALTDYGSALAQRPSQASSLLGRAMLEAKSGDAAHASADVKAALLENPDITDQFRDYGLTPPV